VRGQLSAKPSHWSPQNLYSDDDEKNLLRQGSADEGEINALPNVLIALTLARHDMVQASHPFDSSRLGCFTMALEGISRRMKIFFSSSCKKSVLLHT